MLEILYPQNKTKVELSNEKVSVLLDYQKGNSRFTADGTDCFTNIPLVFRWENVVGASHYVVRVAKTEDLSDAQVYVSEQNFFELHDLEINTCYFWNVTAVGNTSSQSETFSFVTDAVCRTLNIDGVSNTRDIGGKKGLSGKSVKQGMAFRGGLLDEITEEGRCAALNRYKIKTELDLRAQGEGAQNKLNINYIQFSGPYYLGKTGITEPSNQKILAQELKVFADEKNYPIYFHCSLGRDRTGTLAVILQGLLGMSEKDIFVDYEMSFFSRMAALDANGDLVGKVVEMVGGCEMIVNFLKNYSDGNLCENTEKFAKDIGVSDDEISAIRSCLLVDDEIAL